MDVDVLEDSAAKTTSGWSLCGTISAGTGNCALMLRIGIFCPCTVCQTVTGIFGGAVRTGGTGHRAFMLGTGIVRP